MTRRPIRLPVDGRPLLDVLSFGRPGPSGRFSPHQIEQIRRTVSRAPEVMVKVTGGGMKVGAVAAHLDFQGEVQLAGDVCYFARRLPPVRTDDPVIAEQFAQHLRSQGPKDRGHEQIR